MLKFPQNPFEDINPSDFNKLNKKNVTEEFVEENFKALEWDVYKPYTDTGIDRIITKFVCPDSHTEYYENLNGEKCPICNKESIEIKRFIQVKTRELKNNIFGFTLKSKDIRIDPRHTILLYSDSTTETQQDFLILSIYDLLCFLLENNFNPFSPTSFRKGNNKINSLKYNRSNDKFYWNNISWENFRNEKGAKKLQNPTIDLNLPKFIKETRKKCFDLLFKFSSGRSYPKEFETIINNILEMKKNKSKQEILYLRHELQKKSDSTLPDYVIESSKKYFEFMKLKEMNAEIETGD